MCVYVSFFWVSGPGIVGFVGIVDGDGVGNGEVRGVTIV